jgi:hypothetical protein
MSFTELGTEDTNRIEEAWDSVQWRFLVLAVLNIRILLQKGFLTKHSAMKAYWGSGGIAPRIL